MAEEFQLEAYLEPVPLLIVISGPSGVGKDATMEGLLARDLPLYKVVTATSRKPRPYEVHGVDYYFYSTKEFESMIARGDLLEHNHVYEDYKGVPKEEVRKGLESGQDVLLRIDVQGAAYVQSLCPDALLIFLTTENEIEMVQRLTNRHSESDESLRIRLQTAQQEMRQLEKFDYVVVNYQGRLQETVDILVAIIQAEHHRVHPRRVVL